MIGFIIWSSVSSIILGIGIYSFLAKKPVSFFTGTDAPKVKDTKKYNHAVGILWFMYAVFFEALGLPFLLMKERLLSSFIVIGGTILISIALPIVYTLGIIRKYEDK